MKHIILLLSLMFITTLLSAQISFWEGDFKTAQQQAGKEGKNLFVDFYTTWCGPCKLMEKEVFTLKEVGDYFNTAFVSCRLDAEAPENKELVRKYKVNAFPTMLILDAGGKVLRTIQGAMQAEQLLKEVRVANGEELTFGQLYEKYKKDKKDFDVQQQLLIEGPYFVQTLEGYERDKWSARIEALFNEYVTKKGLEQMINEPDFAILRIFHTQCGKDDPIFEHVVKNYASYCKIVAPADLSEYIVGLNNAYIVGLCKKGNQEYKERLERVNGDLKEAYTGNTFGSLSVFQAISYLAEGTYYLYKQKDENRYCETMDKYFAGLGAEASVNDFTDALENLYVANQGKLSEAAYRKSIDWIGRALEKEMNESVRTRLLVMLSDCYVGTGEREKAKQSLNQAFLVSVRIEEKGMQQQLQETIKAKLEQI